MKKITKNFKNTLQIYERRKKLIISIILLLSVLFPFYISIRDILIDSIPFWYDPARDLLMAWDNLKKISLIGPPSGIPGIFYGPYWLWFLSFGLIFSKDPRLTTILVLTLPYFTVFPILFFKFGKVFGKRTAILLWLLFIFGYKSYTTYIWNPHLAPLFFLITVYFLVFTDVKISRIKTYFRMFLAGVFAGLLINVHISFGITITLASILFLIVESRRLSIVFSFTLGLFLSFLPNLLFEIRHGFHQTQAVISTVSTAFLYQATVTGLTGLSKMDILKEFFGSLAKLLHSPQNMTYIVYLAIAVHIVIRHKSYFSGYDKLARRLWLLLLFSTFSLFIVYLASKNPVWSYHFIGVEIIMMLFLGLILIKFDLLKNLLTIWVIILAVYYAYLTTLPSEIPLFKVDNLATKKHIADTIYKDTQKEPFTVFAYSSAIYTFDYDYIFRWFGTDKYPNRLPQDITRTKTTYLIIPKVSEPTKLDFIHYRTPDQEFRTTNEWHINDGETIIKRERITTKQ